jgi:hypothetical protein
MDGSGRIGVIVGGIAFSVMSAMLPVLMSANVWPKHDKTVDVPKQDKGALTQTASSKASQKPVDARPNEKMFGSPLAVWLPWPTPKSLHQDGTFSSCVLSDQ